jgi:hypothetical protein
VLMRASTSTPLRILLGVRTSAMVKDNAIRYECSQK